MASNTTSYLIPVSIVIAGVLIAGAVLYSQGGASPSTGTPDGNTQQQGDNPSGDGGSVDIANVDTEGEPYIGEQDAPVTMAYWSDYQCPFCKRFEQQTMHAH